MTPAGWQRARLPEQKQQRCDEIVAAAAQLFDELGFQGVSLNGIARVAGVAKSNIYRYFASREEIFLALVAADYRDYLVALQAALEPLAGTGDADCVGAAIARCAAERPRLCALVAVLAGVIEQNVSEQTYVAFKYQVVGITDEIVGLLCAALPELAEPAARSSVRYLQALAAALWPMDRVTSRFGGVMERPEFRCLRVEFEPDLGRAVAAVLRGLGG